MSGFRKFRSTLHRRRRSIEAVELGFLATGPSEDGVRPGMDMSERGSVLIEPLTDPETPLDFSPSEEALEIGPAPIAWMKPRKESDN